MMVREERQSGMGEEKFMQTQVSPMTNRKPDRFGVLLCIFLLVGFALSFLGQPVQAQSLLAITTPFLQKAPAGSEYIATLTATGGMPSYAWAITAGELPPGLFLNSATGVISGVPPHGAVGTHGFTVTVTDMHGNMASKPFSITVEGFYTATVTIGMSLPQPCQTIVYVDGKPTGVLKGRESLTLSFPFGTTHTVDVDPLVSDPGNKDRRFKAVDAALTVTEASPNAVFQYTAEYSVSYKTEPPGIVGLPPSDWYPEGSMLTARTTEVVDEPPGTQYRFAHWRLPTGEIMADPQLRVTVKWGGEIVAYFDTFYLLTVFSEHGTPEGSGYYKADTRASWSVTPAEVEMPGVLGFLGGKVGAKNPEGIDMITSPKTEIISWQPDYKMPILITTLVFLFIGLASYLGYRYAQVEGVEPTIPKCGEVVKCPICKKDFGLCTLAKYPAHTQHWPVPEHSCTYGKECPTPECGKINQCGSTCHYGEHSIIFEHRCGAEKECPNKCGEKVQCTLNCPHGSHSFLKHSQCGIKTFCTNCDENISIQCSLCSHEKGEHKFPAHLCGKPYTCASCGGPRLNCTKECHRSGPHSNAEHIKQFHLPLPK